MNDSATLQHLVMCNACSTTLAGAKPTAIPFKISDGIAMDLDSDIGPLVRSTTRLVGLDSFTCAEGEVAHTVSRLTNERGRVVDGAGALASLGGNDPVPALPDWSPARRCVPFVAWKDAKGHGQSPLQQLSVASGECSTARVVHRHDHGKAWSNNSPAFDLRSSWAALERFSWAV
ncbi:hypothetical protein [Paraburkholderia ultramafica]|uniref:hypothetical protein n=1 Tax=Paraburkholderia ultramafica TaxID=1544867 RepID=UPI001582472A|nr:hypothetical protein [Paraburkholderia ultramafica]